MIKKIFSKLLLCSLVSISVMLFNSVTVSAYLCDQYFNGNYTLVGDPAQDMVNVALAQVGMTQEQLGYSDISYVNNQWCAAFVSDCAEIAGCTDAIPGDTYVGTLESNILNAGGRRLEDGETPMAGDIVIYYSSSATPPYMHVGIMQDSHYAVEGNKFGGSSSIRIVKSNVDPNYYGTGVYWFLRPNYDDSTNAQVPDPVPGCLADGDYILRNCEIGYSYMTCVGFSDNDGANISTWSTTNDIDQTFTLKHQGGGAYKIYWKGSSTGKLVDIDVGNDGGVRQGQRVELYTEQAGMEDYQTFNIVPVGNGNYVIECVNDPNYVMGMTGASDGSIITIQRYRDIYGQKWQITKASSDTVNPVVSNVKAVYESSSKRFKITGNYSDNVGVTRCRVAAWTDKNEQDDLVWYDMTMSGGSAYVYVPLSDHNNETGVYKFHMYAYDAADNEHSVEVRLSPDSIAFNSTNFPDSKFREYLKQWDYDQNGGLTADEIAKIEIISIPNMGITNVKGIEYLTALKYFSCENNSITSIDLSNNPNVLAINCADNQLTKLDVSKCPKIENVYCKNNKLTELNVSNNTAINKIVCDNNLLTKLDVSKNTALQILKCSNNKLRCLNLNNNTSITTFEASGNSFHLNIVTSYALSNFNSYGLVASRTSNWTNADYDSSIHHITDICGGTVTYDYDCGNGHTIKVTIVVDSFTEYLPINSTNFPDSKFMEYVRSFDKNGNGGLSVKEIAAVSSIEVPGKSISSLKGIEYFTSLKLLDCPNNSLTSLDLTNLTLLDYLSCYNNNITSIDLSKNPELQIFNCANNKLTALDVSNNTKLEKFYCNNNLISKLDLSRNKALTVLQCPDNKLRCLDLTNNPSISSFMADGNSFHLDIVYAYALSNFRSFNLEPSRVSGWTNADYDTELAQITDICGDTVTYDYDCGNGHTMKVTIVVDSFTEYLPINSANFPDSKFMEYVRSFDTNGNGGLSVKEIAAVSTVYVPNKGISSIKGIEHLTSLKYIDCSNNNIGSLELSQNPGLLRINCSTNKLTSLDVSKNTKLDKLVCDNNPITKLDVTKNTALKYLVIDFTKLNSIDLSKNTVLETFSAVYVPISSLSFNSTALKSVNVSRVNISYLNVSNAPNLEYLKVSKDWLAYIDVSSNKNLKTFICESNIYYVGDIVDRISLSSIKGFDPSRASNWNGAKYDAASNSLYGFTSNDITYTYDCGNSFSADFTIHCTSYISNLNIDSNSFPDSDFRSYVEEKIDTDKDGKLSENELNAVTKISLERHVDGLGVQNLKGIENFKNLTELNCSMNRISSLDLSQNTALKTLDCSYNKLTSLDISKNTALTILNCENNSITMLNVDSNTMLQKLECADNKLSSINLSKNTKLETLSIYGNQLTKLDVSNNKMLTKMNVHSNKLTSLELSANSFLNELICTGNNLTSLDLSNNSAMKTVICINNTYNIGTVNVSYSLSGLSGFDPSKASKWTGAEYDRTTNSLKNFTSTTVTYIYDLGKGFSATFTLYADAYKSVSIIANPTNVTVIEGLDTSLSVTAEGSSLKYCWQKYTDKGWVTISGAVDSVLTLNNVTSDINDCRYRCMVSGTNMDIISQSATITVIPAERVTVSQVKNMTIDQCISFVNAFTSRLNVDTAVLTEAQLYAIERVLEHDKISY